MHNPIKIIDELIREISYDTYILSRDDIDSIECRLRDVQQYIKGTYERRGKQLI